MKLHVLCIGRLTVPGLYDGCREYAERIQRYIPLTVTEIKEHKTGRKPDVHRILITEGDRLSQRISTSSFIIALDLRGKPLSSESFADLMSEHMVMGVSEWSILIGGPFGLSEELRKRADLVLSLSAMTLTHQMARLLLFEQLYRCCTIVRNVPYHH